MPGIASPNRFRRPLNLFSDAEARKHPIQHRFGELFSGDLPQRADRLPQVDRPEVPGQLLGRHLLAAFQVLGGSGVLDEYEFEGDKEDVLANLYQFNLAATLYGNILENVTSENASRMTAMDSASNNAKDMISRLQIQYNRLRQAKITTELTEIVAGAESV